MRRYGDENGRSMVVTHCQTVVVGFEDAHICTCRRIDTPLVGNTGRRAKRKWVRLRIRGQVDVGRTMMLLVRWVVVAVEEEDDHDPPPGPVTNDTDSGPHRL